MAVFQDVIGQEQLKEHLQNAIRTGKISHAYIINGERFAGKEFIAKIAPVSVAFARQLESLFIGAIQLSGDFRL